MTRQELGTVRTDVPSRPDRLPWVATAFSPNALVFLVVRCSTGAGIG